MQFVCTPFRTKYTSQYIYIPFNEIIPQIFNFIYRSGDNRVNKSRRQSLKLPPRLSFFFFFFFLRRFFFFLPFLRRFFFRKREESNYARQRVGSRLIYRYKFLGKLLIV